MKGREYHDFQHFVYVLLEIIFHGLWLVESGDTVTKDHATGSPSLVADKIKVYYVKWFI